MDERSPSARLPGARGSDRMADGRGCRARRRHGGRDGNTLRTAAAVTDPGNARGSAREWWPVPGGSDSPPRDPAGLAGQRGACNDGRGPTCRDCYGPGPSVGLAWLRTRVCLPRRAGVIRPADWELGGLASSVVHRALLEPAAPADVGGRGMWRGDAGGARRDARPRGRRQARPTTCPVRLHR